MKSVSYAVASSLCALAIGILLVARPADAATFMVTIIGFLFVLPGLVGIYSYFRSLSRKEIEAKQSIWVAVVALGSILFGLWLIFFPGSFEKILMYVLGVLLVLAGINQLAGFFAIKRYAHVPIAVYIIPVLVLVAGIVILANPFEAVEVPFIILGVAAIIYALTDILRIIRFRVEERKNVSDAKIIEETKSKTIDGI